MLVVVRGDETLLLPNETYTYKESQSFGCTAFHVDQGCVDDPYGLRIHLINPIVVFHSLTICI